MSHSEISSREARPRGLTHRHAHVTGEPGPVAQALCRMLAETLAQEGCSLATTDEAGTDWLIHVAIGEEIDAALLLARLRAFAASSSGATGRGILLILDLSHAQPRAGDPPPPFTAAIVQRTLAAALPMLALEFAPDWRVNAIGILPDAPDTHGYPPTPHADIAAALRFIIDAPALTGQMIALDGGRTALVPAPGLAPPDRP